MEKFSSIDRIVGAIPEAEKEQVLEKYAERFDDQSILGLEKKEREKTPEELQIISLANSLTNKVLKKYDLDVFDVPPENVHIMKEGEWPKGDTAIAKFSIRHQAVYSREQISSIALLHKTVHELLHFKSYNSMQVPMGGTKDRVEAYRVGLTVAGREGKEHFFRALNEAITEELAKRIILSLRDLHHPLFAKEFRETKETMAKATNAVSDSGRPLFSEDTFYVQEGESEQLSFWQSAMGRVSGKKERKRILTESFGYTFERSILHSLTKKLFEKNKDRFKNSDEVLELFTKAMMTGNLLEIGRLVDNSFEKGTFRKLGELDALHPFAQREFIDAL